MSAPSQFPFNSYTGMSLRKKPSAHSLGKLQQLDTNLNSISQSLDRGTHLVDLLALQKDTISELESSIYTQEDRERLDRINTERYLELQEKIKKQDFQPSTAEEKTVKRHMLAMPSSRHILERLFPTWFSTFNSIQKHYKAENNGLYPIRDTKGLPIYIKYRHGKMCISDISIEGIDQSKRPYPSKPVIRFLSPLLSETQRAALYDQLSIKKLPKRPEELKNPLEKGLCGQNEVVATRFIPKGTCLGVYGGKLFDGGKLFRNVPSEILKLVKGIDKYFLAVGNDNANGPIIDGDNILSRINTTFDYNDNGKPYRQAPASEYNTERADFEVELANGKKIRIPTLFTTQDIEPDTAIRFNYELTPEMIQAEYQ